MGAVAVDISTTIVKVFQEDPMLTENTGAKLLATSDHMAVIMRCKGVN